MTRPLGTFARIPERFTRLLEHGTISFEAYGMMVYLVARCDYDTGRWVGHLSALKPATGYRLTVEHLRQVLWALRDLREISFEVRQGQRQPWVITIIGDGFGLPSAATSTEPPSEEGAEFGSALEVDLQRGADEHPGNPDDDRGRGTSRPPTAACASGADLDLDQDQGQDHSLPPTAKAASASSRNGGLQADDIKELEELVEILCDRDENTLVTFRRNFSDLGGRYFRRAREVISRNGARNDAEYAYGILRNLALYGDSDYGLPPAEAAQ